MQQQQLTDLANERVFSSITPFARRVQPAATVTVHFRAVLVTEQVVRFCTCPFGVAKWFPVVPARERAVGISAKTDPNRVVSVKLTCHPRDEVMLISVVYGDQISAMLLAASFCNMPESLVDEGLVA